MSDMLVSVCVITYNHCNYIRQCLDGILMQQTSFPFEIIINDDCSTDGTTEIIKEYVTKYPDIIRPIFHEENQYSKGVRGMFATFCFPKARGKYIALCEGDDYWTDPLKLQKQVDFLESHPDYSMCFHRASIINELSRDIPLRCKDIEHREYSANELFSTWLVPTASMVYKAEVNAIPIIRSEDILNWDLILVLQCCTYGKVMAFVDEMSVYRMHSNGVNYSKQFHEERAFKYPAHLRCIKRNFANILSKKIINRMISGEYWNLIELGDNWLISQFNKLRALYFDPIFIISKYFHRI